MIYEILRFQLPSHLVYDKVAQFNGMGVELIIETCLGRGRSVDNLFQQGHQTVAGGSGVGSEDELCIPGQDREEIYQATEFLKFTSLDDVNVQIDNKRPSPEIRQVVIFGGDCGTVDYARTATAAIHGYLRL